MSLSVSLESELSCGKTKWAGWVRVVLPFVSHYFSCVLILFASITTTLIFFAFNKNSHIEMKNN